MKVTKEQFKNLAFIVLLGLIVFTPLGFYPRVFVARLLAFSPSEIEEPEQQLLYNYQWQLSDLDGNSLNFSDLKGRVILVNSWATWCPPCVAEMPSLQELYLDYHDKIEFVFVTSDDQEKVHEFLKRKAYTFPSYFESSQSPELLSSEKIPTTYIIDAKGKIVVEKTGAANWNSISTRELLDKLIQNK